MTKAMLNGWAISRQWRTVFIATIAALLVALGATAVAEHYVEKDLRLDEIDGARTQLLQLIDIHSEQGTIGLEQAVNRRVRNVRDSAAVYALIGPDQRPIAASSNLRDFVDTFDTQSGPIEKTVKLPNGELAFMTAIALKDGHQVITGRLEKTKTHVVFVVRMTMLASLFAALFMLFWLMRWTQKTLQAEAQRISGMTDQLRRGELPVAEETRRTKDLVTPFSLAADRMVAEAGRVVDSSHSFAGFLTHDLRPLFLSALKDIEAAQSASETKSIQNHIEKARLRIELALDNFSAVAELARAKAGLSKDRFEPVPAKSLAQTTIDLLQPLADDYGVTLQARVMPHDGIITGHPVLLQHLVVNLVHNALKHAPIGTVVDLTLKCVSDPAQRDWHIEVTDRGKGIPHAERERLIKPFESHGTQAGSGLGLALADSFARLHGGSLALNDNEPGLKVTVSLAGQ